MVNFSRECPSCNKQITYKHKNSFENAVKLNSICRSCGIKSFYKENPDFRNGENNGRSGISLFDLWIKKHGEEHGKELAEQWREKQRARSTGSKNSMYGKTPPQNSGRSYKGWYKDLFFRSTFELAFILEYEQKYGHLPISAEKGFRIKVNEKQTYVPDFFCTYENTIIEIKCNKLKDHKSNLVKYQAAIEYCNTRNLKYKVLTEDDLILLPKEKSGDWLINLHRDGTIKLESKTLLKLS